MDDNFDPYGNAIVIGASGGIGAALMRKLESDGKFRKVIGLSRTSDPALDLTDEDSIRSAASYVGDMGTPRLVIIATGVLHGQGMEPEKSHRALTAASMANSYAVNTIGPALIMKHFLPLFSKSGKSVMAALSAKVGSIGDNHLGGWYSYRASKAALNQIVHTAAIELRRSHPKAVCVALHPGTVDTGLSGKFAKSGLTVQPVDSAAEALIGCVDRLKPENNGAFLDRTGEPLPW
ncbi:SDR family oxidoreductase [Falsirhodobacter sp. alg1]|uniref:SDR family oxidoreductase n=1 Tax=Falsirhodobacter sp. alg1 TaxID=1472418 RepID=UPI0005EDFC25|nr:SDR family oxidoreductase [Falsirhodobacter sp. alg1]